MPSKQMKKYQVFSCRFGEPISLEIAPSDRIKGDLKSPAEDANIVYEFLQKLPSNTYLCLLKKIMIPPK